MSIRFVACAYPSRSCNGFSKQEILERYRKWADKIKNVEKLTIQDDLYSFTRLCPYDVYTFLFVEAKKKVPLVMNIDGVKMRVAFKSKVEE